MWIEPDGEGFGKILYRMRLSVPAAEIDDVVPALHSRRIGLRVGRRRIAEQLSIALAAVQDIGIVDGVAGFMPKYPTAFGFTSPFNLEHLGAFQPHEARMHEIEGDGEPEHTVWAEELFRQPGVRKRHEVVRSQLAVEALDAPLHQGAFQLHR